MNYNKFHKITLKSTSDINMSNWQITNTINNFTIINNKFDILYKLNNLLNNNINPKNVFIMSKSSNFSTSYITYFEQDNIIGNKTSNIIKMIHLGKIIPLEPSSIIHEINSLFDLCRYINSVMKKNLKCRLRSSYLQTSYENLFTDGLESASQLLVTLATQQINDFYEKLIIIPEKQSTLIKNIQSKRKSILKNTNITSTDTFIKSFNRLERPVVGKFDDISKSFEIINSDQLYKNGEYAENGIKLTNVSKNSPVSISFLSTGLMLGAVCYLAYRQHTVNNETVEQSMNDMPQTNDEAIDKIFVDDKNEKSIDPLVRELSISNLEKLEKNTHKINITISKDNGISTDSNDKQ